VWQNLHWRLEHCTGPLGLGTLLLKPLRHVERVGDLSNTEAAQLGTILVKVSAIVELLSGADQVYNCLWSHPNGVRSHIHYLIQPVAAEQIALDRLAGPYLQVSMLAARAFPDPGEVEHWSTEARSLIANALAISL
jgi:diadenosine tetraphosphate (Ap4A) HIT family hydrolase